MATKDRAKRLASYARYRAKHREMLHAKNAIYRATHRKEEAARHAAYVNTMAGILSITKSQIRDNAKRRGMG